MSILSEQIDVTIKSMTASFQLTVERMGGYLRAMGIVSPRYLEARRREMKRVHTQYRQKHGKRW